jgi:imidazolonepropionase-like amidohydrolase
VENKAMQHSQNTPGARHAKPAPSRSARSASALRPLRALLLSVAAITSVAHAQDLGVKAAPQSHPILILHSTLHPVTARPMQGWLLFDLGKIQGLGIGDPPSAIRIPPNTETIDGAGKHLYPGLFAANTQLGLAEMAAVRASNDIREVGNVTPEVRAAVAVNPDSTLIPVTRSNGVLTAAVFPEGGRIPGRVSVIRLDGWTWEDMAVTPDAGITVDWPNMRPVRAEWMERSDQEQGDDIRKSVAIIDDAFSAAKSYFAVRAADPAQPVDLRWEAMRGVFAPDAALGTGVIVPQEQGKRPIPPSQRPVFINAQDIDQITSAVAWALKNDLKPVIVGGRDAPMAADLLKRHDIPVIVTGTHAFPKRSDSPYDDAYTLPARLKEAGVRFAIASADRTAHERNLPYNAAMAVAFGLDPDTALRSITLAPAEILGLGNKLGALESLRAATIMLTDGDILEIPTHVQRAWIDGREIDLSNKQTKLAEKYREKYRQKETAGAAGGNAKDAKGP